MAVASFGALTTSTATAGEFCRQDVTGHMTGCDYSTMEQCQAASAGIGGDCFRDPNLTASQTDNHNAFAYQAERSREASADAGHGSVTGTPAGGACDLQVRAEIRADLSAVAIG